MNKWEELGARDKDIHSLVLAVLLFFIAIIAVGEFLIWLSPIVWGWLIGGLV